MDYTSSPVIALFGRERERLLAALGRLTEGGCVDAIELLGAASLAEQRAAPGLEIGLAVWPFPLGPGGVEALAGLGYQPLPATDGALVQRFRQPERNWQLYLVEAGGELWAEYLVLRGYLQHTPEAARAWPVPASPAPEGGSPWSAVIPTQAYAQTVRAAHTCNQILVQYYESEWARWN